jgi:hypothetical protein
MDRTEAAGLLRAHMGRLQGLSHCEAEARIGDPRVTTVVGGSGTTYFIEVDVFWDAEPGGRLRVLGSIDDGSLRGAFSPVCDDFLIESDGPG